MDMKVTNTNKHIKRLKRFNISKDLSVPRAFVEKIRVRDGNIYMSVSYRRARAFCCYTADFQIIYRVEERELQDKGFGDYRTLAVSNSGEMIICSLLPDKQVNFFTLDRSGKIKSISTPGNIPLPQSIAVNDDAIIYIHSLFADYPIYRYHTGTEEVSPVGIFPDKRHKVTERIGQLAIDNDGKILIIYENYPVYIQAYCPNGELLFEKKPEEPEPPVDLITSVLDFDIEPDKGNIYILRNSSTRQNREVEIITTDFSRSERIYLPSETRRIGVSPGGIIYSSRTGMSVWTMLTSMHLYGAATTVDKYTVN
jgi:hypothetical protein